MLQPYEAIKVIFMETVISHPCSQPAPSFQCRAQTGSDRAQNTVNILGDVFVLFGFLMYFQEFLWDSIIPKLLMFTSGHIAILVGTFWELPKNRPNMDPRSLYLLQKYLKQYKKTWKHFINLFVL